MEYITIVLIRNESVDRSMLFIGDKDEITIQAEEHFLKLAKSVSIENWKQYTPKDHRDMLDAGYFECIDHFDWGLGFCPTVGIVMCRNSDESPATTFGQWSRWLS